MSKLKPIKCWDCLYLAKCRNYSEKGCEKFAFSLLEISKMINLNFHTLRKTLKKNREEGMRYINELAYPKKFRCEKINGRYVYERYK